MDERRRRMVEAAWRNLDANAIGDLLIELIEIPSVTGHERQIAEYLVSRLRGAGLETRYQAITESRGNAIARLGESDGPELLLFSPIDTPWAGTPLDVPGIGRTLRADFIPRARRFGEFIVGLGASNPKAFVTAIVACSEAIARADIDLTGALVVGLASGGMPVGSLDTPISQVGHGLGCTHLLEEIYPDFAVVTKPGYAVAYEEAGMLWIKVTVRGELAYTGTRHLMPYNSSIAGAAHIIQALEGYVDEYPRRHSRGFVSPQAAIGSIVGGWPDKPAFTPDTTEFHVDLRIAPGDTVSEIESEFDDALRRVAAALPVSTHWERTRFFDWGRTDPSSWIVRSLIRAWEAVEERPHQYRAGTSGTSEGNILRANAIPTARIGLPIDEPPPEFSGFSMGVVTVGAVERLARLLCVATIDSCTRTLGEVGINAGEN